MKPLKIIYYIVIAFIAVTILLLVVSVFPITGNIKFFVVQSGSMEPAIRTGGIVMVKSMNEYEIGDVISFGEITKIKSPTTHRIYDIKVVEGNPYYITKGDANNAPDQKEIPQKEIIGKVLVSVPFVGYAVDFAKKPLGFALIVGIPAVAVIGDEIRKIVKELKKKKTENK